VEKIVLGELWDSTLIYEENYNGGIKIWAFLGFCSGFHVEVVRRGGQLCFPRGIWGKFLGLRLDFGGTPLLCDWGYLWWEGLLR
jgi:hypothetical protein